MKKSIVILAVVIYLAGCARPSSTATPSTSDESRVVIEDCDYLAPDSQVHVASLCVSVDNGRIQADGPFLRLLQASSNAVAVLDPDGHQYPIHGSWKLTAYGGDSFWSDGSDLSTVSISYKEMNPAKLVYQPSHDTHLGGRLAGPAYLDIDTAHITLCPDSQKPCSIKICFCPKSPCSTCK